MLIVFNNNFKLFSINFYEFNRIKILSFFFTDKLLDGNSLRDDQTLGVDQKNFFVTSTFRYKKLRSLSKETTYQGFLNGIEFEENVKQISHKKKHISKFYDFPLHVF